MAEHDQPERAAWEGELFRLLVENVVDYAIFVVDPERRVRSWSHGAERLLGYTEPEILGEPADRFFTPEDVADGAPRREVEQALATGRGEDDRWHVRKDGSRFWSSGVMTPLRDEGGTVRGFAKIMRDLTAWWHAERSRLRSEARTAAVLEAALDAIVTIDHEGKVVEFNPAAERMFGYARAEVLGRDMAGLIIPPGLREAHHRGLARYLATGEGPVLDRRIEIEAVRAGGAAFPVELAITRVPIAGPPHFTAYLRDITGRQAQERRRAAQLGLTQALAEAPTVRDAAPRIVGAIGENLGWDMGAFWLVERVDDRLRCIGAWHRPSARVDGFEQCSRERTFARGEGLPGRVWETGRPAWVVDVAGDDNFPRLAVAGEAGIHGAFAFPVLCGSEVLGVVELFSKAARDPDRDLMVMVENFAAQVGQFVERKRIEESLRDSEGRFRGLMEQAPFSIQVFGPDGRTLRVNRAWERLWGVTLDQVADYNIFEDPQLESKGALDHIRRAFAGEPSAVPAIQYDPNETIPDRTSHEDPRRWVAAVAYPLKDDAGRVREVVLVQDDISDRMRAEEALRSAHRELESRVADRTADLSRANDFLRALLESIQDGIVACDAEGVLTLFNRATQEFHGLPPEPLAADDWADYYDLFAADGTTRLTREEVPLYRALRGERVQGVEMVIAPRHGPVRTVLASGQSFQDDRGRTLGAVVSMHDITARKEAESALRAAHEGLERRVAERTAELARANEALRGADRRKDEFLATLAHELRNPLAPIRTAARLLAGTPGVMGEAAVEVELIERQTAHLARLVDDLMDVARINEGKIELRKELVDLEAVVGHAVEAVRPAAEGRGHALAVAMPGAPILLEADPTRLDQVIGNLLTNAIKYTEPGGRIALEAGRDGDLAVIRVRDTGIGILPEMLPRIFEMFAQVDGRSTRSEGGLGIGLGLVKSLVEMHGGTIEARSDGPGLGSEFVARLPAIASTAPERAGTRPNDPVGAGAPVPRRRILVVDDNVDAAESLAKLLSRLYNQEVRLAHDGPEALSVAEEFHPEAVLLDIGLPGMDGNEVARRLRERPEFARILLVALTGWGQQTDLVRSRAAGFDHHLVKPASPEVILGLLAKVEGGDR